MKKKIWSYLLLALFSVCQLSYASQSSVDWVLGDEWFSQVEKDYKEGKFSSFLEANKASFAKEHPNGLDLPYHDPKGLAKAAQEGEVVSEVSDVVEKSNRALDQLISKYPSSPIRPILQSSCKKDVMSASQKEAFALVELLLFTSAPPYNTPFAANVRNIVGEYNIRRCLVTQQCMNGEISSDRKGVLELVLQFEKYRALMEAAKNQNEALASLIPIAYEAFRFSAPQVHDGEYVNSLGNGERTPKDACEEEVAEIMKEACDCFSNYFKDKFNNS